ncbi:beta-ketoacyl synthase N-terminal-like domain-containing protein [Clostridium estertheticum]|uniref:beta-ketoacyl synthase N-terminal-like domain-containing protein n=1 Tax=Clostridium estertheticum TaxID=238834 RepID=UPI001C0BFD55|nr:beta-ketoacyl synthase N-terminal-like domain-containing protein [Clostridium estertheticum]MBU3187802.1 polyketide synthase dehydratase domain-containing protein [Clostridium estertheticum]
MTDYKEIEHKKLELNSKLKDMGGFLNNLLWGILQSMGIFKEENGTLSEILKQSGVSNSYKKWLEESVLILVDNNYLKDNGGSYVVVDRTPVNMQVLWKEWDQRKAVWLEDSSMKAQVILVEATMKSLSEILIGKRIVTDIMFPNSSMKLVEGIYKNNLISDYFNELVAKSVVKYIEDQLKQNSNINIRIIEIGAGTGGTSSRVLKKLVPYKNNIVEYCYTDISKAFLLYAEKEYGPQNPYLTYKIFNIEKPINEQNINKGVYDIVIATNVLHATKNIKRTLCNAKAVLKRNGLIILNEINGSSTFSHLTFGLLEGWWLYEDTALRIRGCPALESDTWKRLLQMESFEDVTFPAENNNKLGQQIIVAKSDGVVLQSSGIKTENIGDRLNVDSNIRQVVEETNNMSIVKKRTRQNNNFAITEQMIYEHVSTVISDNIASMLKINDSEIRDNKNFSEYGVDSIIAVSLVNKIGEQCKIMLQTTILFDYNTIDKLTKYIIKENKISLISLLENVLLNSEKNTMEYHKELSNVGSQEETKRHQININMRYTKRKAIESTSVEDDFEANDIIATPIKKDLIAIIGMSGQFAKSKNVDELWEHLSRGDDLIEKVSRWDLSKYYTEGIKYCDYGSFLDDIDKFDPLFFNISGSEATYMDPQQRIFLEESWKALEDSGYAGLLIQGSQCGVYVGCSGTDYDKMLGKDAPAQAFWGKASSLIPARIAYYLDLKGPAIAVDTACSSSLIAIHLACQSLRDKEIDMALAGGVLIQSTPDFYIDSNRAGMLSATGHCHTFDDSADGFVPGEGVGVVVLKRLKEALVDGDHIYGVIRGSGINQDGATNGITAPSVKSQESLESKVYDDFNINPEQIQVVEAHGTGTKLGDPIEYQALSQAFRRYTDKKEYCTIGSIKTNIGHLAPAAGVAGLIKILLSLQHKQIPASLNYNVGNSNIQFKGNPFYVNSTLKDWSVEPNTKRCAALSAFGLSGTNAHMVIEEAPISESDYNQKQGYLIVLSARTNQQLQRQAEQLVKFCGREPQINCGNMSFTLLLGRKHLNCRLACVVRNQSELTTCLKKWLKKGRAAQVYVSELNKNEQRQQMLLEEYGNDCINNINESEKYLEKLSTISELYIQGYALKFKNLFLDKKYSRISLPTYPFANESYWVPDNIGKTNTRTKRYDESLEIHPLLHQNISDLYEQRFSSIFTGHEFFFKNVILEKKHVLPGIVCIEMVQTAIKYALGIQELDQAGISLRNNIWINPINVDNDYIRVNIRLLPKEDGEIDYEIYESNELNSQEQLIYCRGNAVERKTIENLKLDIDELKSQCSKEIISSNQCYEVFSQIGVEFNEECKCIEKMYIGDEQIFVKVLMPSCTYDTENVYVMHPSLMDSVLQASIGFITQQNSLVLDSMSYYEILALFTVDEVEIISKCSSKMWALIRYSKGSTVEDEVQKLDIDLCEDNGNICVQMKKFASRLIKKRTKIVKDEVTKTDLNIVNTNKVNKSTDLLNKTQVFLVQTVSELLEIKNECIDMHTELNEYGFDSITLTKLCNKLNNEFNFELDPTVFFEYQTLYDFAEFLVEKYKNIIIDKFSMQKKGDVTIIKEKIEENKISKVKEKRFIEDSKKVSSDTKHFPKEQIAIIGMSGKFPMANDVDELWENLMKGQDCITEIPGNRWEWRKYYGNPSKEANKTNIKWGGFIDGVGEFDPEFFGISPKEAEFMDPQQRLLMTYIWNSIEDAGYSAKSLSGTDMGIFVGTINSSYNQLFSKANIPIERYTSTGQIPSVGPNRMSYFLNVHGPSEPIETACSSSLIAIHHAVLAIENGDCNTAIVGGVNTILTPEGHICANKAGMLSEDGRCKTFTNKANGYVRSESVGMIFLKKLKDAELAGDHIYGIIRGSNENHGGRSNSLTAPNPKAQVELLEKVYNKAGIDPRTITYIEAHGTGTALGDPIEINALKEAFKKLYEEHNYKVKDVHCGIGSVKTNIGHSEIASGIAGVIKVLLQLKHKTLVKNLHFDTINPYINLEGSPFYIVKETGEWKVLQDEEGNNIPRRAGISSFGLGGVNAHVVIEEYIPSCVKKRKIIIDADNPAIIVLSAKNKERLKEKVEQLLFAIRKNQFTNNNLSDMAYTLQVGREAMKERLGIIVISINKLEEKLIAFLEDKTDIQDSYKGNVKSNKNILSSFIEDEELKYVVDKWIQNKKYSKLLDMWSKGLNFDWNKIYEDLPGRISLPTYPFAKEYYWVPNKQSMHGEELMELNKEQSSNLDLKALNSLDPTSEQKINKLTIDKSIEGNLKKFLSKLLEISEDKIDIEEDLLSFGFDSISLLGLAEMLNNYYGIEITPAIFLEHSTLKEITSYLLKEYDEVIKNSYLDNFRKEVLIQHNDSKKQDGEPKILVKTNVSIKFPELIHLNKCTKGKPIFWIHPALGGVEIYHSIAQNIKRPFYGIQARGWMTKRSPLQGIDAISLYYVNIIQSIQPEGPYDLGGFSLGGVLAYEIARILQEMGQAINTIVMLDSLYDTNTDDVATSTKEFILQGINTALFSTTIYKESEELMQKLIHRDELNWDLGDEAFFTQINELAQRRGLNNMRTHQLRTFIEQITKIQKAYRVDKYSVLPLVDPESIICYYLRNKNGLLFGKLEPYFSIKSNAKSLSNNRYWEEWEKNLLKFHMIDIDCPNHMMMLYDHKSYEKISVFCKKIYSSEGIQKKFKNNLDLK